MPQTLQAHTLRVPIHRRPTLPGEMLVKEFLEPPGTTQTAFAAQIGVTYPRLNEIVRGKRAVSVDTAMRFARATKTTPGWWLQYAATRRPLRCHALGEGARNLENQADYFTPKRG